MELGLGLSAFIHNIAGIGPAVNRVIPATVRLLGQAKPAAPGHGGAVRRWVGSPVADQPWYSGLVTLNLRTGDSFGLDPPT
jgi:hypothetical protein